MFRVFVALTAPLDELPTPNGNVEDAATQTGAWGTKKQVKGTGGSVLGEAVGNARSAAGKAADAVSDTLDNLNNS